MRRKREILAAVLSVMWVLVSGNVFAQAPPDYTWVFDELQKPVDVQNQGLIDQKLAAVIASPEKLAAAQYQNARVTQVARTINATAKADAPEKRRMLNEEYLKIVSEIGRLYLGPDRTASQDRLSAYSTQLSTTRLITDSPTLDTAQAQIADAILKDVAARYLADKDLSAAEKESILRQVLTMVGYLHDKKLSFNVSLGVYSQILALGTPSSKEAYMGQVALKVSMGQTEDALTDLAKILADSTAGSDLQSVARSKRMEILANAQRWNDANPDAVILADVPIDQTNAVLFKSSVVAEAKRLALKVRIATAGLTRDAWIDKSYELLVELLSSKSLSAEEKSRTLTDMLLDLSKDAAGSYQWQQALGFARSAYNVAPNTSVPATVTLVQQLLAHGSKAPVSGKNFSVTLAPEDIAKAQAFYARQVGQLKTSDKVVILAPDLSNQDQFPIQLSAVGLPFKSNVKDAIAKLAAEHPDPLTRALAQAMLFDGDKAVETMAAAVNGLALDSSRLSDYVNFTARFVRAKFESVALANAFLRSQAGGATGPGGQKVSTPNPLMAAPR